MGHTPPPPLHLLPAAPLGPVSAPAADESHVLIAAFCCCCFLSLSGEEQKQVTKKPPLDLGRFLSFSLSAEKRGGKAIFVVPRLP